MKPRRNSYSKFSAWACHTFHTRSIPFATLGMSPSAKAESPIAVFVIGGNADGVAARVGGIVIGAVVVDGPVGELKVGIRAHELTSKKSTMLNFAEADFKPAARQFLKKRESIALVFDFVLAQREYV